MTLAAIGTIGVLVIGVASLVLVLVFFYFYISAIIRRGIDKSVLEDIAINQESFENRLLELERYKIQLAQQEALSRQTQDTANTQTYMPTTQNSSPQQ